MEEQKFELVLQMTNEGILCNAETLKGMLPTMLRPYDYIVTTSNYDDAKKDRTKLNALYDTIQAKRKQFEEVELQDWKKAKAVLMDIEKIIKSSSDTLKTGLDGIDEDVKVEKMNEVKESFDTIQLPLEVKFEKLYDRKKYDVKAFTVKKIQEDMQVKVNKIGEDSKMMELFLPTDEVESEQIKQVYCDTLDLGLAKAKADDLLKLHQKVADKQQEVSVNESVGRSTVNVKAKSITMEVKEEKYTRAFQVVDCSKQQIIDLGNYMNEQGIKFRKVEI